MPPQALQPGSGVAPVLRCDWCGVVVEGTRHTRTDYTVGHYLLFTGRTEEASRRRHEDEAPIPYLRLLDATVMTVCPTCFARPDVRRFWFAFGAAESSAA